MNIPKDTNDLIDSPLQQIEKQLANARRGNRNSNTTNCKTDNVLGNVDRESIYSFESVSTNGRLLDRLGLDNEEYYEDEDINFGLSHRDSVISVKSTGRLLDRLGIDDDEFARAEVQEPIANSKQHKPQMAHNKHKPIITNSYSNTERAPSNKRNLMQVAGKMYGGASEGKPVLKTSPVKVALPNQTHSIDPLHADLNYINNSPSSNKNGVTRSQSLTPNKPFPNNLPLFTRNPLTKNNKPSIHSTADQPVLEPGFLPKARSMSQRQIPRGNELVGQDRLEANEYGSSSESVHKSTPNSIQNVNMLTRPSPSVIRSASTSAVTNKEQIQNSPSNRVASDSSSPSTPVLSAELSPNARTQTAMKLRNLGKDREASYQLRIAASIPNNFPKAMYLYGIALKYGQGVKQNTRHSLKWFCKCILISQQSGMQFASKLNDLEPEDMISIINKELENKENIDPNELHEYYSKQHHSQLTKIANISKSHLDVVSASYHEVGLALIEGRGFATKNEIVGIRYLSKAASIGYIDSMVQLGDIWSSKSKSHKKDYYKAASWLRLSEIFGVKSIGNSWIYKDKYMPQAKFKKNT